MAAVAGNLLSLRLGKSAAPGYPIGYAAVNSPLTRVAVGATASSAGLVRRISRDWRTRYHLR